MFNTIRTILSLGLILQGSCALYSQSAINIQDYDAEELTAKTEQILGPDDLLVNGEVYRPDKIHVNGSPDFEWDENQGARLFIKGQRFDQVDLSYDIVSDHLILHQHVNQTVIRQILLHSEFIDSFYLGDRLFINLPKKEENQIESGYFEQVTAGRELFLRKYKKTFIEIYESNNRGKYSPQKSVCYLSDHIKIYNSNSRRAFLSFYADHKKDIREFMRKQGISYKQASNKEITHLMNFCYALPR